MKVTVPDITDKELATVLKRSGMTKQQIDSFFEQGDAKRICSLRKARKALLDTIHEEQALLDRFAYLIWCSEHKESGGSA